jgi:hypothetical protein
MASLAHLAAAAASAVAISGWLGSSRRDFRKAASALAVSPTARHVRQPVQRHCRRRTNLDRSLEVGQCVGRMSFSCQGAGKIQKASPFPGSRSIA